MAPFLVVLACRPGGEPGGGGADTSSVAPAPTPADGGAAAGGGGAAGDTAAAAPETTAAVAPETTAASAPETVAAGTTSDGRGGADAAEGDVDWMRVDESARRVEFDIVAGLTPVNGNWNFNGYANGDMTITVPVGWTVVIEFSNRDANVPHSFYVSDLEPPFPGVLPETPAIPRAYSVNLRNGLAAGRTDTLRFPVNEAGRYTLVCGVAGHAASGMWDWFVVSGEAARPSVSTAS